MGDLDILERSEIATFTLNVSASDQSFVTSFSSDFILEGIFLKFTNTINLGILQEFNGSLSVSRVVGSDIFLENSQSLSKTTSLVIPPVVSFYPSGHQIRIDVERDFDRQVTGLILGRSA